MQVAACLNPLYNNISAITNDNLAHVQGTPLIPDHVQGMPLISDHVQGMPLTPKTAITQCINKWKKKCQQKHTMQCCLSMLIV